MSLSHYVDVIRRTGVDHDLSYASLHSGQFHDVLIAPDRVYRFLRTAAAAAGLSGCAVLLTSLNELDLGVATPIPLSDFDPAVPVGESYLVLSRVHGSPLDRFTANAGQAIDIVAAEFARLLRAMAASVLAEIVPTADPGRWAEFAASVRVELFPLMSAAGRERAERELAVIQELDHIATGLVHGDLGGENVLWQQIEELPRLIGVVDWDGAMIGDPAEDLAAVGASYGLALLDRIVTLLGVDRVAIERRIAAYQGTFALQQALAGARDGDDEQLEDGLNGYR